jgi:hypothetical protein
LSCLHEFLKMHREQQQSSMVLDLSCNVLKEERLWNSFASNILSWQFWLENLPAVPIHWSVMMNPPQKWLKRIFSSDFTKNFSRLSFTFAELCFSMKLDKETVSDSPSFHRQFSRQEPNVRKPQTHRKPAQCRHLKKSFLSTKARNNFNLTHSCHWQSVANNSLTQKSTSCSEQ